MRHLGRDRTHGFFSLASPMSGGNAESVSCSQEEKSHLKDIRRGRGCKNRGTAVSSRRYFPPKKKKKKVGLMLPRGEEPPERHHKGGVSKQGDRRFFPPFLPAVSFRRFFPPFLPAVSSRRFFPTYIFPTYLPAVSSRRIFP